MFINIRSGRLTRQAGVTDHTFTEDDVGNEFRADITLSGSHQAEPRAPRQLLIESISADKHTVYATIVGT